jgi:hypothetical protein
MNMRTLYAGICKNEFATSMNFRKFEDSIRGFAWPADHPPATTTPCACPAARTKATFPQRCVPFATCLPCISASYFRVAMALLMCVACDCLPRAASGRPTQRRTRPCTTASAQSASSRCTESRAASSRRHKFSEVNIQRFHTAICQGFNFEKFWQGNGARSCPHFFHQRCLNDLLRGKRLSVRARGPMLSVGKLSENPTKDARLHTCNPPFFISGADYLFST